MSAITTLGGGDRKVAASFRSIWVIDFEFNGGRGENPNPVCLVAHELRSGRAIRLWRDELVSRREAPFDIGAESLVVAYFASAEISCFLQLGWNLPANVLDLFTEHRVSTNGLKLRTRDSLLGALAARGLAHINASEKDSMRRLILERSYWSPEEQKSILDYCESDVDAEAALFRSMIEEVDLPRALLRGRYSGSAVARMQRYGIPMDVETLADFNRYWKAMKGGLIAKVDINYLVYEGLRFSGQRFQRFLEKRGIEWPRLPTGKLALDDETFKAMSLIYPELMQLRYLRQLQGELRLGDLEIGSDGRNRSLLSQFRAITGRNQPSTSKFVFGLSSCLRGLIKPPAGLGLAYIDFSSQEIAIAAALSGDELMMEGYRQGDPYLAFAKQARLVPEDATKHSHRMIRDRCKTVVLGINYGMGVAKLAQRAGISVPEASELLKAHRRTYQRFWRWADDVVSSALLWNRQSSVMGWERLITSETKPTSIMNFPMQANGAEMMRFAAIAGTEAGIEVCAPVHDAFLILAPLAEIEERAREMSALMSQAGAVITGGFPVRTSTEIFRYPDRYREERSGTMWEDIFTTIDDLKRAASGPSGF